MGPYWLPVNRLISIILKAFEPIAPFVACKQEDGDIPEVSKQLRLKERLLLGRRFGLGLLIKWLLHVSDSHFSVRPCVYQQCALGCVHKWEHLV